MARVIMAFNGDLESRLALHWLVHERGHEVRTLSVNLGQEVYLEPLGELAFGNRSAGAMPSWCTWVNGSTICGGPCKRFSTSVNATSRGKFA